MYDSYNSITMNINEITFNYYLFSAGGTASYSIILKMYVAL